MRRSRPGDTRRFTEAAAGFALGAAGGCMLGAAEDPVDEALRVMTSSGPLRPVMEGVAAVGPLGLGSLLAATALTTAMASVTAGVILAAAVVAARGRRGSTAGRSVGLWVSAGLAGAAGTALTGAAFGTAVESVVESRGAVGLLWALSAFTALKAPLGPAFKALRRRRELRCSPGSDAETRERERAEEAAEWQRRRTRAAELERRIAALENGGGGAGGGTGDGTPRAAEQRLREETRRRKAEKDEADAERRTARGWIDAAAGRYVDFLAFSGMPMTVVAVVTSVLGLSGYGGHQAALIALLVLVAGVAYFLLSSPDFKFWMLLGSMGTIATFVVAMLTLHAGQLAVSAARRMREAGQSQTREAIGSRMNHRSAVEALNAAVFVARLCQLGLGATVGGALVRRPAAAAAAAAPGRVMVVAGAAAAAALLLAAVEVLAPVLGDGGRAGALLGVVGAAGVSAGAALAAAGRCSSWEGTLGTIVGVVVGAAGMGRWHAVNIGLQLPVAYVFAMINPF